ncbi:RsiV family protein [Winogradskyella rapida]|uniref:RsiV family protein n=1 Tax=Winogradskyella rapida TaxID=549701 RepID=A0ABW3KRM1_9FLAO
MKYFYILIVAIMLFSCKNDPTSKPAIHEALPQISDSLKVDTTAFEDKDMKVLDKAFTIELKQKELIEKEDESHDLETFITSKTEYIKQKDYTINFTYPVLSEQLYPRSQNFNQFIQTYYANIAQTETDILQHKALCDSIEASKFREERFIDYKIYDVNDQLVSVLFYKENFYSGSVHPTYAFEAFNFDFERGVFMTFKDFFLQDSEEELVRLINKTIRKEILASNMYYDCWEISLDDFLLSKDNFVLNDTYVEFYFDDCVICPSYTGTYSIALPLTDLLAVLKKFEANPLVF